MTKRHWKRNPLMLAGIAAVIVVATAVYYVLSYSLNPQNINASEYQAVYLTNGQMYFGKLQNTGGDYLYIKSPYMPQSTNTAQSGGNDTATGALIRVRDQLWGPEDSMAVRASQVAFWQNLRDDSKVSQAIKAKTQ